MMSTKIKPVLTLKCFSKDLFSVLHIFYMSNICLQVNIWREPNDRLQARSRRKWRRRPSKDKVGPNRAGDDGACAPNQAAA